MHNLLYLLLFASLYPGLAFLSLLQNRKIELLGTYPSYTINRLHFHFHF